MAVMLQTSAAQAPNLAADSTTMKSKVAMTEQGQWRIWISKHGHQVLLSLLALGLPLECAEEVAQSAWQRLIEKQRSALLPEIKMPGLVLAQARFLALDYLRRESTRRGAEISLVDVQESSRAWEPDPQRSLLSKERGQLASSALAACSPASQRVFRLYYVFGKNASEIATEVQLSTQRVRQILCEVRASIRLALEAS